MNVWLFFITIKCKLLRSIHHLICINHSFLIGFGSKYPQHPHHGRSSCPDPPEQCGWDKFNNAQTNHELTGALVGGCKAADDNYNDSIDDYFSNEITLDYNAGFQSTIAGLQMKKCCSA